MGCDARLPSCMSSIGLTNPEPNSSAQVRLTIARAKYGLSAAVIHFADTCLAESGKKSFAFERPGPSVTPILVLSAPLLAFFGLSGRTFAKNSAMPQYSACFHSVNGWLWHWAHWSWRPRKFTATLSV